MCHNPYPYETRPFSHHMPDLFDYPVNAISQLLTTRARVRGQQDIDLDLDDIGHYRYRHRYWVTVDIDIFIDNHYFPYFFL